MNMKATLAFLRELPTMLKTNAPQRDVLPFSLMHEGLPKGALTEISGTGKTEVVLRFIAENPETRVAWIEDNFTVYPCALPQNAIDPQRILFVDTPLAIWSAHQTLRSQIFGIVVLASNALNETELRRLQLSAEKSGACVILLADAPTKKANWPISVQIAVQRCSFFFEETAKPWILAVLKYRGQNPWEQPSLAQIKSG